MMEKWRYSGRGRRGGGSYSGCGREIAGGRGWERGRSVSPSSATTRDGSGGGRMAWVRPKESKAAGIIDVPNKKSGDQKEETLISLFSSSSSSQVVAPAMSTQGAILRGPRNHGWGNGRFGGGGSGRFHYDSRGRGRGGMKFQPKKNTWRREGSVSSVQVEETKQRSPSPQQQQPLDVESNDQFADATDDDVSPESPEKQQPHSDKNELLGAPSQQQQLQEVVPVEINDQFVDAASDDLGFEEQHVKEFVDAHEEMHSTTGEKPNPGVLVTNKVGDMGSKLASTNISAQKETQLEAPKREQQFELGTTRENSTTGISSNSSEHSQQGKMVHKGTNKLVLAKTVRAPIDDATCLSGNTSGKVYQNKFAKPGQQLSSGAQSYAGERRNRTISSANVPNVKRIKLNNIENGEAMDEVGNEGESDTREDSKGKSKAVASSMNDTLTDFAYRETSSNRGRGGRFHSMRGGRGFGRHQPRVQNMGLVRVDPDETKAPICPTFLRGIRCEDELCRKRHDVPIESARPVCSFFQRHGQCLKGSDCPFRHVKVNPLAVLCPSFNLMGYCDDEKCVMKHVAANRSVKNKMSENKNGSNGKYRSMTGNGQ